MKNNLIICLLFVMMAVVSCNKSFLERLPVGQVPKERMFQDVEGLVVGLNGTYSIVAKYHMGAFGMLGDLRGDDVVMNPSNDVVLLPEYNYQVEIDNDASSTSVIWRTLFEALNNTNNVINATVSLKEQFPNRHIAIDSVRGQALVLRALINFNLTQAFSQHYTYTADASHLGIPVLFETPFPGTPIKRQSLKEVYAQVIKDLEESIGLMTGRNNTNQVTASVEAAQAFLSRVYLYMENWQASEQYASQVLQNSRFSLVSREKYQMMYIDPAQRTGSRSPEVIWQFNLSEVSNGYINILFSEPNLFKVSPSGKLLDLYEDEDIRSGMFASNLSGSQVYTLKYALHPGIGSTNWPVNYKVFRLAEIYLNRAEARWHLRNYTGAEQDLRVIIGRAYGIAPAEVLLEYTNPSELLELIKKERRKELAFEGHRIYDITRYKENLDRGTGCVSPTCGLTYPNDRFVLPIPQIELDANPQMQQNPGY